MTSAKIRLLLRLGSLSTRDFETRTESGSALFSLITRLRTITSTLLSTFSPLGMIRINMWETPLSWHAKCSLPVAVRVSKTRLLKLPIVFITARTIASLDFISAVQCMILFIYHFVHRVDCHQFAKSNFTDQQEMEQQQQAEADIAREKLDEMETALGDEIRKKEACEHEIQQHLQVRK